MGNALAVLDEVEQKLAAIATASEAKEIRDQAEALRAYVKRAHKSLALQNRCAVIKLSAERQVGAFLRVNPRAPRGGPESGRGEKASSTHGECLRQMGISWATSVQWEHLSDVPDAEWPSLLTSATNARGEITSAAVYSAVKHWRMAKAASGSPEHWADHLRSRMLEEMADGLGRSADRFLAQDGKQETQLAEILTDRKYLDSYAVEQLRGAYIELRRRLSQAIEALTLRMNRKMDKDLDTLVHPGLLAYANDDTPNLIEKSTTSVDTARPRRDRMVVG